MTATKYPIGRAGHPWNDSDKQQWLAAQKVKRSYADDVMSKLTYLPAVFKREQYGALEIDPARYPLIAISPVNPDPALPDMLITGGVHGYETSGVQGALEFALKHAQGYSHRVNLTILPCVSPWGYETINRWNASAVDPNRSFYSDSPAYEAEAAMKYVANAAISPVMHIDLHETTDTDNSEFRPALAARDDIYQAVWDIPDGFYLVADTNNPAIPFQEAIIQAVGEVTHIAEADEKDEIIGSPILGCGIIGYDKKALYLCAGMTDAKYVTTTEVYPDSPRTNDQVCIQAQVASVHTAIKYVLNAFEQGQQTGV